MLMTGCYIEDAVSGNGGLASMSLSKLNITQSVVSNSTGQISGGVIYMSLSILLSSENVFRNNISPIGGVIYSAYSIFTISHDKFYHNGALLSGGVIFMENVVYEGVDPGSVMGPSVIDNCYFHESTSQRSGAVGKSFLLSNVVNCKNLATQTKKFLIS